MQSNQVNNIKGAIGDISNAITKLRRSGKFIVEGKMVDKLIDIKFDLRKYYTEGEKERSENKQRK